MDHYTHFPKPRNHDQWESWCRVILAKVEGLDGPQRFKGAGFAQFGIDLLGSRADQTTVGVQCKLLTTGETLTPAKAQAELDKTEGLSITLDLMVFATTADHRCLQEWAEAKNKAGPAPNVRKVKVYAWPDFEEWFNQHPDLRKACYPGMYDDQKAGTMYAGRDNITINAGVLNVGGNLGVGGGSSAPTAPKPRSNLPPVSQTFVLRQAVTEEIHKALHKPDSVSAIRQAAARAHGGYGKTVAAVMYGDQYKEFYNGGRFFLSMEKQDLVTALASLAKYVGVDENAKPEAAALAVKEELEREKDADGQPTRSLLIFDNIVDAEQWAKLVATGLVPRGECRVLITTRAETIPQAAMVRVGKLTNEEAREIFRKFCTLADVRGGVGRSVPTDPEADAITGLVGGLAVAVAAVAARMKLRPDLAWGAYARKLKEVPIDQLPDVTPEVRAEIGLAGTALAEHRRTLHIIDGVLDDLPPAERRAIEYAALLPEDMVPRPWLLTLLEQDGNRAGTDGKGGGDPLKLTFTKEADDPTPPAERVLAHLDTLDLLVDHAEAGKILSLHRLWRQRVRERAEKEQRDLAPLRSALAACAAARRALVLGVDDPVKGAAIDNPRAVTDSNLRWELAPLAAFAVAMTKAGDLKQAEKVAWWLPNTLRQLGRLIEARAVVDSMLASDDAASAQLDHPELTALLNALSVIQQDQGDLQGARASMERAIAIKEKHFAPDHPTFAISYSNLAMIQQDQGDLREALDSMQQAIEIDKKHFATDHPTFSIRYSNLAGIQKDQGDLQGAQASMERAIAIQARHFAPDHPNFASLYNNMQSILYSMGDFPEARKYMEKAIAIDQKHFSSDHPKFAARYFNLATICHEEGNRPEAARNFREAIRVLLTHFDESHPHVKIVRQYMRNGGYAE